MFALQSSGALLLDVREPDEYAQEHVPGSTLIPLGQLEQRLQEINAYKNKPVEQAGRSDLPFRPSFSAGTQAA